ncbi:MAG: TrmH family RNA methyltransferase [Acidimicrobiia bacterium]
MLEGPTIVRAALDAAAPLEAAYVAADARRVGDLPDRLVAAGVPERTLAAGVLERIADVVTPQGVVAVCRSVTTTLSAALTATDPAGPGRPAPFVLVGLGIGDPGNAGTMIRTADATGAAAVVLAGGADVAGPKVVRAAAGSLFHLPVVAGGKALGVGGGDGGAEVLGELGTLGFRRLGASAGKGLACDLADLTGPVALVVGNEAHGLPGGLPLDGLVHVPMAGRAESLNVAMAATVLCYEAARQRRAAADASQGRGGG